MLIITLEAQEVFDETTNVFRDEGGYELVLEHSLASVSKWESEFEKPFLGDSSKTPEELMGYIRAMVVGKNPPGNFLEKLSKENIQEINDYMERKHTATWFSDSGAPATRSVITAELIYFWMIQFNIPWEAQHWHLNKLFTLIRVCDAKSAKPKKMSRAEIARRNAELNRQRQEQYKTKG